MSTQESKRSFWRFGGKLDSVYNWLIILFFVVSLIRQIGRFRGHLPEALGAAIGQTVVVAILLFVLFKIISAVRRG